MGVHTNFDSTGHRVSWGKVHAPFSRHVTLWVKPGQHGTRDVFVNNCPPNGKGTCGTHKTHNTAFKDGFEANVDYSIILDNWGSFCKGSPAGATPGCSVE